MAGETIARQWCAECHAVGAGQPATDVAPPFTAFARDPAYTDARLSGWLADPHPPMPKLDLTRQIQRDIIAYIRSLEP